MHQESADNKKSLLRDAPPDIVVADDSGVQDKQAISFPDVAPNYNLTGIVGQGGMGTVYLAEERSSDQKLAIKVIRPELATDRAALKRFQQESLALADLNHPNIVAVISDGKTDKGAPYVVMDYIPGQNLSEEIKSIGSLDANRALSLIIEICDALKYAHAKGIIHRDLKPSNIILMKQGHGLETAKVVDFGIAKVVNKAASETVTGLTQVGDVFGTPTYMSPEQCEGEELDARSDIYSFGCVMYEMLSGRPPFSEANPFKLMTKHVKEKAPALSTIGVSRELAAVVAKCLEKRPEKRYQSVDDLMTDLAAIQKGSRPRGIGPDLPDVKAISKATANGKAEVADVVESAIRNLKPFQNNIRATLLVTGLIALLIFMGLYTGKIQSTISSITTIPARVTSGSGIEVNTKPTVAKPIIKAPSQQLSSIDVDIAKNDMPEAERLHVRELLKSEDGSVEPLRKMGLKIVPTLIEEASSQDRKISSSAKAAIMAMGPSVLPILVASFKQDAQPATTDLIMRFNNKGLEALSPLFFDDEPKTRVRAIQSIYYASESTLPASVTDTLVWLMLEDFESQVRSEAATVLAKTRSTPERAQALEYSALNDEAFMVRRAAISSLFRVTEYTNLDQRRTLEIGGWLIQHDPNVTMRTQMVPLVTIGKIGPKFAPYVKGAYANAPRELKRSILSYCNHKELKDLMFADLVEATADDDLESVAMGILGQLGSQAKPALPALEAMKARIVPRYSEESGIKYRIQRIDDVIKRIKEATY